MKTKELIGATNSNIILSKLTKYNIRDITIKEVIDYYDGIVSALIELNNNIYYAVMFNFEDDSYYYPRKYIILNTIDHKYNSFEDLMNRDIEILGYFYEY